MSTPVALLQIAAGGGDKMDGLEGYCCVCNLTSNPDLKAIFTEVIYEPLWFITSQSGCNDQSYFTAFGMFYPLAINENVLGDLASNYRRGNDF